MVAPRRGRAAWVIVVVVTIDVLSFVALYDCDLAAFPTFEVLLLQLPGTFFLGSAFANKSGPSRYAKFIRLYERSYFNITPNLARLMGVILLCISTLFLMPWMNALP